MLNSNGLTNKEVNESRNKYGSNSINGKNKSTFISLFIETLGDPIIKILLIALFIKVIFLDIVEKTRCVFSFEIKKI